ncbi:MAG: leucine-rich repeat domain-containing protein, partial [Lachnospiraceae bacterium]|nr:leucine-rich repeat domain-containing protein [Lachnospiraceae bacterium]
AFNGSRWYDEQMKRGGDSDFVVVGDGVLIGYKGQGGSVSVPAGVKTIGAGCFADNKNITEVILPQGLSVIGEEAFMGCSGLKDISFPDSVKDIEDRAFKNSGLKQVIIPSGVENIGIGAFDRNGVVNHEDRRGAVVFLGNELPGVSYKNTATRLSASDLRTPAFAGYDNAIVGSDVNIGEGSVLSPQEYGFRGQVYVITSDASADTGELRLISSFSEPQDSDGNVVIDPHVTLNGKNYIMSGVSDNAFDSYRSGTGSVIGGVKNVSIEGNTSPELSARLEELSETLKNNPTDIGPRKDGGSWNVINTQMDSGISPDREGAYAYITGDSGSYHIKISDAGDRRDVCDAAFINKYGDLSGITMVPLDISMYEDKSGVSIKRLSGKNVDIELPIPTGLISESNIMVGAINDNNELETIPSKIVNHGGNDKIKFVAAHFSTFVVYTSLEQTTVLNTENEQNLSLPVQSAVVGTLKRDVGGFGLRWYAAAIMLSAAGILIVYDHKNKGSKTNG